MNLKSGRSLWAQQNRSGPKYPALHTRISCDVAVIGAGITGALVAHELVKSGRKVVVVDRRAPGTGSTSASTALLLYETDTLLADLVRRHGRAAAERTYHLGRQAIREIGTIARSLGIECGFSNRKCLYLASDRNGLKKIKTEFRLRRRAGFSVVRLSRRDLRRQFGLNFPGALYSTGSAQVDALSLAQGLLASHRHRRALRVYQDTKVTAVKAGRSGVRVDIAGGAAITAGHVVIATGYAAAPFLADRLVQLHATYVVASHPLPRENLWKDRCLVWETARPYHYLRTTDEGRMLIGGADEPFADAQRRDAKLPGKARQLARHIRRLFPRSDFRQEFAWCGTFGESADGLPYIGAKAGTPRVLYALGYGGNGITFSQIAAKIIGRICRGRRHPDAFLFRFDRENNR